MPLYPLGRSFCSEKSKDISSIVYLIPNRRQYQHSFISFRYVKLIAIRTREDRHCQRCHHRRASRNPSSLEPSVCHVRSPIWKETKEKKDNRRHRSHHPRRRHRHRRYVYVILVSKVSSDNALVAFGRNEYEERRQREREKTKKQVFLVFILIRSTVFPIDSPLAVNPSSPFLLCHNEAPFMFTYSSVFFLLTPSLPVLFSRGKNEITGGLANGTGSEKHERRLCVSRRRIVDWRYACIIDQATFSIDALLPPFSSLFPIVKRMSS